MYQRDVIHILELSRRFVGAAGSRAGAEGAGRAGNTPARLCSWGLCAMATAFSALKLSLMRKILHSIRKQTSPQAALKSRLIETHPSHKTHLIILVRPEGCVHTSVFWRAGK